MVLQFHFLDYLIPLDKLVSHGEQTLPNPLDLVTQMKMEANGSPIHKKKLGIRPQTAQYRPNSISFTHKINTGLLKTLQSPNSPGPLSNLFASPDKLISKTKSDKKELKENKIRSMKTAENSLVIQTKQSPMDFISSPVRSLNKKNFSIGSSAQTLPLRNWEIMDEV